MKKAACSCENDTMRAERVTQNSQVVAGQINIEVKLTANLCIALESCRFGFKFSI